ncbi:hypothetical protein JHK85_008771 [Glycine max]|uniref:Uncharacterized protein n=1 Tax=Glycine soja TaxID=3848 RepID=A0A0B2RSL7_GLYSO|nr:hypothetical protein JHK85_008771 [Glycine max]KHN35363.1 hypothetical protein glysoja_028993 [Glycine soja]
MPKQQQDHLTNTSDPDKETRFPNSLHFNDQTNQPYTLLKTNQYREILYSISLGYKRLANKMQTKIITPHTISRPKKVENFIGNLVDHSQKSFPCGTCNDLVQVCHFPTKYSRFPED